MNWTDSDNLDWTEDETWTNDSYPGPETGHETPNSLDLTDMDLDKFGFKARTKYGVYSCPSLPFLKIKNRAKIKRHVFCSGILDCREKALKKWNNTVLRSRLKPQSDWIKKKTKTT